LSLVIASSFGCFAFATTAAEFDFGASDFNRLGGVDRLASEGAFDLLGFSGGDQLQIGFGSKFLRVGFESFFAVVAAQRHSGAFVVSGDAGLGRFSSNGAHGFAVSGECLTCKSDNSQYGGE
jgi:hypothetical protein